MAFEVYFGNGGIWERVVLEGSGVANDTTIKTATDLLTATVLEAGSTMSILQKTATDTLRSSTTDSSQVVGSGSTLKVGSDIIRPVFTESARIYTFMSRTDTIRPQIGETVTINKSGEGVSRVYGSGIYGSGPYGTSNVGTVTTTTPVTVDDNIIGNGELQHDFSSGWTIGTGAGNYNGGDHYTSVVNSTWTFRFKGTRARLYGVKASNHGIASISVDGNAGVDIDYYSSVRQDQVVVFDTGTLIDGSHTLVLTVTGRVNPAATGSIVTVDFVNVDSSGLTSSPLRTPTNEPFDGTYTLKIVDFDTPQTHPHLHIENPELNITPVEVNTGLAKLTNNTHTNSYGGHHKMFGYRNGLNPVRYGEKASSIRFRYRARATSFSTNLHNGFPSGVHLGIKWPKDSTVTGYSKDNPNSVRGGRNNDLDGIHKNPYSMIFRTGFNPDGVVESAVYDGSTYIDNGARKIVPYTTGAWRDVVVQIDKATETSVRIRYWHNADMTGTPVYDYTTATPKTWTELGGGYIWYRTDFANFEYDYMIVEEL